MTTHFQNPIFQLSSQTKKMSLEKPKLMGVLNRTPDSFSDGGQYFESSHAIQRVRQMLNDGVDCIDIGGESSGPGSSDVSIDEELQRVIPIIEAIRKESDVWISVDTWKSEVAQHALDAGADMINDVTALRGDPRIAEIIAEKSAPVVIMYSKDPNTRTTTTLKEYEDVIETITQFFDERLTWMQSHGISLENVVLDPGMGFFVSGVARYSFQIIRRLQELRKLGNPILLGPSRKSFLAGVSPDRTLGIQEREIPGLIAASIALWQGASFIRLHDVAQGRLLIDTLWAIQQS